MPKTAIKVQRLKMLGHVHRMDDERDSREAQKTEGRRDHKRLNSGWIDEVESDLERMSVRRWKTKVEDRREWKEIS